MNWSPSEKMEFRKKSGYKVSIDKEDARRKREENMVEIRKNKRQEGLLKKRREGLVPAEHLLLNKFEVLSSLTTTFMSQNEKEQLDAVVCIRESLSKGKHPPIDEIVKIGAVPDIIEFLRRADVPQLQFEAAWILTNIASGTSEHTRLVIEHGSVPLFVQLLCSSSEEIREQAIWALGNISGDSSYCRDLVLSNGAMTNLLPLFNERTKISTLRTATWTLSNFCRGRPPAPLEQVKAALPTLVRLLESIDTDILIDACWAVSYISERNDENFQAAIEAGACPKLVKLLRHDSLDVFSPSLITICNIATGNDAQTQHLIDNNVLPCLLWFITDDNKATIRKQACRTISNITAGNKDQVQAVIDADIIPPLIWLLTNAQFDIKKEAAWAISNAMSVGTPEQIKYFVGQGCVQPLCDLLSCQDIDVVGICIQGMEKILKAGDNGGYNNEYATILKDIGVLDKLEALQHNNANNDIYEKAVRVVEKYLTDDEDGIYNITQI